MSTSFTIGTEFDGTIFHNMAIVSTGVTLVSRAVLETMLFASASGTSVGINISVLCVHYYCRDEDNDINFCAKNFC